VPPGGSVELSVGVRNPAAHPGERTLTVVRDDESVASKTVRYGASETGSVTVPVRLGEPGASRLRVANRSLTVTVATTGATGSPSPSPSTGTAGERGPGVGVPGAVLAVVVGGWLRARD
jgi:hypothetical protein